MELAGRASRVIGDNKLIVAGVASFVMQPRAYSAFVRVLLWSIQSVRGESGWRVALAAANYRSLINPVN